MLALVDNVVARIEPALEIQGGFSVDVQGPFKGTGKITVKHGDEPLVSGVTFFTMTGDGAKIDPRTGEFRVRKGEKTRFRAIFSGQHRDVEFFK
jgi:hypothetical protein